jgi:methyl-accepting chemotaxis protein
MKIKAKLSLLVIAIMAVVVSGLAIMLLRQASGISVNLSHENIHHLMNEKIEYWKGKEEKQINVLYTLANVMAEYEDLPAESRRDRFNQILKGTIDANPSMINLYTIWKPNALDNMDNQLGQYVTAYTRETGVITSRPSADVDAAMAYLNGPSSRMDRVENPFPRKVNGKDSFLFRMMVPIINPNTNEVVGGVGCLLTINAIQSELEKVVQENDEITIMVIYSNSGFILGHVFPDRVGKMTHDVDVEYGSYKQAAFAAIANGTEFTGTVYDPTFNTNVELMMESFSIGNSGMTWSILIGTSQAFVLKEVTAMTKFTILLTLGSIIAAAAIVFVVLYFITKPIVHVTETLKDISEGEGDLTKVIPVSGNDEVAELSRYFNKTLDKIKNLIINIKRQAVILNETGNDLASNITETSASMNEITSNIRNIKNQIVNQSASVNQTSATMNQITDNIDKLHVYVDGQAESVAQSSSAIEQMLANINSVTKTLEINDEKVHELSSASDTGRASLQNVAANIQEIARESEDLMKINSVMNNIASQTNLLSMNAAIEAAHAGNAGKGFAVVADEIRKLAESSGEQSKTIGNVLKKIKSSIDRITETTAQVLTEFEAIDSNVKTVTDQEESILNAMAEQNEGSKQILESVSNLNRITRQVKEGSTEMHEDSHEVIKESQNLEKVTAEISNRMNEMASGAEQINIAVTRVNEISIKNKENIDNLVREVSRFKVA